ncbi:MAG: hypothetical protein KA797_04755 [Chitinophagales bacterium]|nr:hypothetical protein [Chitinophagales bacterium]
MWIYNILEPIFFIEKEGKAKIVLIKNLNSVLVYILFWIVFLKEYPNIINIALFLFILTNIQIRVLQILINSDSYELDSFEYMFWTKKKIVKFKTELPQLPKYSFITRENFFDFESKYSISFTNLSEVNYQLMECDYESTFNKIKNYIEKLNISIQK